MPVICTYAVSHQGSLLLSVAYLIAELKKPKNRLSLKRVLTNYKIVVTTIDGNWNYFAIESPMFNKHRWSVEKCVNIYLNAA